ncbi:hypothetical protein NQ176_g9436 [Zarea fungicola]|uniref:Uncharacterized protein n=1 Tax=Zarea fungicola TaxID=93591 RepID=A0ACC1MM70_9HYPO|nr:hypothetical protein NQ176_g9436 [Lecanicillium fungicola]
MRPLSLILLAALGAAVALPPKTGDARFTEAELAELAALPPFPQPVISNFEDAPEISKAQVERDTGLTRNKLYRISGWAFYIGSYVVDQYRGTNWVFPSDAISIDYIANQVASDIIKHPGNGGLLNNVGGGWSYYVSLASGYSYNNIPYPVLWGTITLAIQGANDWLLYDNAFSFTMQDTNHQEIFSILVYPTIHSTLAATHD